MLDRCLESRHATAVSSIVLLANESRDVLDATNPFSCVARENASTEAKLNCASRHRIAVWVVIGVPLQTNG